MIRFLFTILVFSFLTPSFSQADTIEIDFMKTSDFVFMKTYPKAVNPHADSIFSRKDSLPFSGLLLHKKVANVYENDTAWMKNTFYHMSNGVPEITNTELYRYTLDTTDQIYKGEWLSEYTQRTDTSHLSITYYPNGQIKSEQIQINAENIPGHTTKGISFNENGIITRQINLIKGKYHGTFYQVIRDSLKVIIEYDQGLMTDVIIDDAMYFSLKGKPLSKAAFIKEQNDNPNLNWQCILINETELDCFEKPQLFMYLYQYSTPKEWQNRKKILLKKLNKGCKE